MQQRRGAAGGRVGGPGDFDERARQFFTVAVGWDRRRLSLFCDWQQRHALAPDRVGAIWAASSVAGRQSRNAVPVVGGCESLAVHQVRVGPRAGRAQQCEAGNLQPRRRSKTRWTAVPTGRLLRGRDLYWVNA